MTAPAKAQAAGVLEVSVVLPLEDPRGDIVEHLSTWAQAQTLPRERYQLVVSADGQHPEFEREVRRILAPQDRLVTVSREQPEQDPGGALIGLYDAAARAAEAPVLVITEAHCAAEPECLALIADAFARDLELDAVTFPHHQNATTPPGELTDRWFARVFEDWERAGWTRLNLTGFAIRAEAYANAGGLDPHLCLYASSFMSAQLHELGSRVRHIGEGGVRHELEEGIRDGIWMSRSFARGEARARIENDPEFCDRYFGPAGLLERGPAYDRHSVGPIMASLLVAAVHRPSRSLWLIRELMARVPALLAGARPRLAWEWASSLWFQAVAGLRALPEGTRWRAYVQAHERTVRAAQLRHISEQNGSGGSPAPPVPVLVAQSLSGAVVGIHGLEELNGRRFRWTEPVALLRLRPPADGDAVLRIDTGGLRGDPASYLGGIYAGRHRLAPDLIASDGETLEARLPAEFARAAARHGIVLLCTPLVPSSKGSSDRRRLGMPVIKIELSPA